MITWKILSVAVTLRFCLHSCAKRYKRWLQVVITDSIILSVSKDRNFLPALFWTQLESSAPVDASDVRACNLYAVQQTSSSFYCATITNRMRKDASQERACVTGHHPDAQTDGRWPGSCSPSIWSIVLHWTGKTVDRRCAVLLLAVSFGTSAYHFRVIFPDSLKLQVVKKWRTWKAGWEMHTVLQTHGPLRIWKHNHFGGGNYLHKCRLVV